GIIVYTPKAAAEIYVIDHRCVAFDKFWGSPCERNKEKSRLSMVDVTKQEKIEIIDYSVDRELISITHFVPYCRSPAPKPGGVDMLTSFPFSRFVEGQRNFILAFGVRGAEGNEWVGCWVSCAHCTLNEALNVASPMLKDKVLDLLVFYGIFTPRPNAQHETYLWLTEDTHLTVTVDYTQNGTSPEVEECSKYGGARSKSARQ
ncbi:unnamed protein product, partial [Taenia asiatica]|uniref:DUF5727 domain-containing protein n=1 Tax=Taenia asiatica TaxID=60517 RepID=A0A0R3WEJ5_TAEAS